MKRITVIVAAGKTTVILVGNQVYLGKALGKGSTDLDGSEPDPSPTPLEESIGRDLASRYEAALLRLSDRDRAVLFLKIEMDMDDGEIADALDKPSADAARMAVHRAGIRLAREMQHARQA